MSIRSEVERIANQVSNQTTLISQIASALKDKAAGVTPTGTIDITENGTHDVTNYAQAEVNVETGVFPSGTLNITENGEYDVMEYEDVNVNVPVGVFPNGTLNITDNGEYDVTQYEDVNVNVEKGVDTSDATATADDITVGTTAYISTGLAEGTNTYKKAETDAEVESQSELMEQIVSALEGKVGGGSNIETCTVTLAYSGLHLEYALVYYMDSNGTLQQYTYLLNDTITLTIQNNSILVICEYPPELGTENISSICDYGINSSCGVYYITGDCEFMFST